MESETQTAVSPPCLEAGVVGTALCQVDRLRSDVWKMYAKSALQGDHGASRTGTSDCKPQVSRHKAVRGVTM